MFLPSRLTVLYTLKYGTSVVAGNTYRGAREVTGDFGAGSPQVYVNSSGLFPAKYNPESYVRPSSHGVKSMDRIHQALGRG